MSSKDEIESTETIDKIINWREGEERKRERERKDRWIERRGLGDRGRVGGEERKWLRW